jgi:hypothetical protein
VLGARCEGTPQGHGSRSWVAVGAPHLIERFGLDDPALRAIGEVVHDIDLKDEKFGRKETLGIESLIAGIAVAHRDDETRYERGSAVFDDLYEFSKRR